MGIDKDDGGENTREDVMIDANVENVGSAEKRTKVENEKGFAYSRFKPKEGETEGEGEREKNGRGFAVRLFALGGFTRRSR